MALFPFLLVGCTSAKGSQSADVVTSTYEGVVTEEGRLYFNYNSKLLTFFDFTSDQEIPVCAKPDCKHNKAGCAAYFPANEMHHYAFYDDRLYFFLDGTEGTALCVADRDGSNRKTIAQLKEQAPRTRAIFTKGKVYFDILTEVADETRQADERASVGNFYITRTENIACIDLATGKLTKLSQDRTSHYGSLALTNYDDQKLYYDYVQLKDGIDEDNISAGSLTQDDYDALH